MLLNMKISWRPPPGARVLPPSVQLPTRPFSSFHNARYSQQSPHPQQPANLPANTIQAASTWLLPNYSRMHWKDFVEALPPLSADLQTRLTSALFLITPGLARWLDGDNEFLRSSINRLYGLRAASHPPVSTLAVIDALPPHKLLLTTGGHDAVPPVGAEGIAICFQSTLPESVKVSDTAESQALIRFHAVLNMNASHNGGDPTASPVVNMPVANTLFINGRQSTISQQRWSLASDPTGFVWKESGASDQLSRLSINVAGRSEKDPEYQVPLRILTPWRTIVSSMGNVLREVKNGEGNVLKASAELEAMVPEFIKREAERQITGPVQVYAMIMPAEHTVVTPSVQKNPKLPIGAMKYMLHRKGRLHRVTGGGGGWGKKAGLLSLDTKINFELLSASDFSIEAFSTFEEDSKNSGDPFGGGDAIPVGHHIQFLGCIAKNRPKAYTWPESRALAELQDWSPAEARGPTIKAVLGTMPTSEEHVRPDVADEAARSDMIIFPSVFGMLSQAGASLSLEKDRSLETTSAADTDANMHVINQFRVDVPNSFFRMGGWAHMASSPPAKPELADVTARLKKASKGYQGSKGSKESGDPDANGKGLLIKRYYSRDPESGTRTYDHKAQRPLSITTHNGGQSKEQE